MPIDKTTIPEETKEKYEVLNESFAREVKENPKDKIEVEIGDTKQPDFKPQFKILRWDNEVNFSMRAEEVAGATVEFEGEKIKYVTPEFEVHQYDKPEVGEDGGFEFEWLLKSRPATNVLSASIRTKGLDFFKQLPLDQFITAGVDEEVTPTQHTRIDGKHRVVINERAENVINSYAVYHSEKKDNKEGEMEYRTGKAFHIYRPHVRDSAGNETWGDIDIDAPAGILTVTVPQEFLDNVDFENGGWCLVDPTFGYTSLGASFDVFESSCCGGDTYLYKNAIYVAISENGNITQISFGAKRTGGGGSGTVRGNVRTGTAGSVGTNVATGSSVAVNSGTLAFLNSTVSYSATTGSYWLEADATANSTGYPISAPMNMAYDTGGGANTGGRTGDTGSYGYDTFKRSIYATYTAAGAAFIATPNPRAKQAVNRASTY